MIIAYVALTVTDPDSLAKYRENASDAVTKHGGRALAATPTMTVIDGAPNVPDVGVLVEFPDKDAALAWINDPEFADLHDMRRAAGASDIFLFG
jgi:uncharacterized protein (DUF1330 family)